MAAAVRGVDQWTGVGRLVVGCGSCVKGRWAGLAAAGRAPRGFRPRFAPVGVDAPVAAPLGRPLVAGVGVEGKPALTNVAFIVRVVNGKG